MATRTFDNGIQLDFDDAALSVPGAAQAAAPGASHRSGARFSERPTLIKPAAPVGAGAEGAARALADRLAARGTVTRTSATIPIGPGPAAPARGTRAAPGLKQPTRLSVPLAPGEQAVVLVEGDGVLAWRFGSEAPASALAAAQRGTRRDAVRVLEFDLGIPPIGAALSPAERGAQRGWLRDRLVEGVKAIVLYFAAEAAAAGIVYLLERKKRNGPVIINSATDPAQWQRPDTFDAVALPQDRAPRILLLVHGTFSSTLGGFGELTVTPWGQRLLTTALQRYDAVLGFDHRTLSLDPLENATVLMQALATLKAAQPIEIDAVCHSRGGLVLRTLIERLLPGAALKARVRRAIFVAATNRGTELARPDNWETLVDLVTNLSAMTSRVLSLFPAAAAAALIADEAIDALGDFVKYLVEAAVEKRRAPGLSAMDPGGEFVREINLTQPGQPLPADIDCYAIVSDFYAKLLDGGEHEPKEMPKRLAFILADGVIDRLMRGAGAKPVANDLVVDVASMTEIDSAVGGYVKDVLDFGRNALVYHTNYFLRPETVQHLAQWLRLPSPTADIDPLRLAGGMSRGLRPISAEASVAQVRAVIASEQPEFLVFAREHPFAAPRRMLHYAVRPREFLDFTRQADASRPVIDAFHLNEVDRSNPYEPSHVAFDRPSRTATLRPHARRSVIVAGESAAAVLDAGSNALDMQALAALAQEMAAGEVQAAPPPRVKNGGTRGGGGAHAAPPPRAAPPKKAAAPKPEATEVFATAEMPREVSLRKPALVSVTLSAEQIEAAAGSASAQGSAEVSGPITVQVVPRRGYDYPDGDTSGFKQVVDPPAPREPCTLDFTLVANEAGPGEVLVLLGQGARRVLTLTLRSTVLAERAKPAFGQAASSAPMQATADCGACAELEIIDRRNAGQLEFIYQLKAGGVNDRFASALNENPEQYIARRYKAIEDAWTGSARAVDRFRIKLEATGAEMCRELFPLPLRQTLWRLMQAGQLQDILVDSTEPFVPWEMVFIDDPDAPAATGQGKFFGELGLCRWLRGAAPVCSIRVRRSHVRHVVPHYAGQDRLAAAEEIEQPMLENDLGASAIVPSHAEVLHALRTPGSFDLLHFACHGQADAAQIDEAALLLQGELIESAEGTWSCSETLSAAVVAQFADLRAADGNRPLVVVNACQAGRIGRTLKAMGGFAPAFLGVREGTGDSRGRAGAFVGALWSVGDFAASTFVKTMYQELRANRTMSQAVRKGREAARDAGEGTWLAYAVYAHPHLRVTFSA